MDNVYDIKFQNNLNFILPMKHRLEGPCFIGQRKKIVILVHLHYLDTVGLYLKYMEEIPSNIQILITTSSDEVKEALWKTKFGKQNNCKIIQKPNRGRDISAFLVTCREEILKYEYICFLHDKKEKCELYKKDTEEWIRCLWENMIGSMEYIHNILMTFYENPNLGLLVPPSPLSEHFPTAYVNAWYKNFYRTKKLAEQLDLACDLNESKSPITLGSVFWAKVSALKKLFDIEWKYEDFDEEPLKNEGTISYAIERILAYVAQDAGFETGWAMTDRYAGERIEYMHMVLKKAFDRLSASVGVLRISELDSYESRSRKLLDFVSRYECFYIYGAGIWGKRCLAMLKDIGKTPKAFLVSNMDQNPNYIQDISVYPVSKINLNESCGVIIAVSEQYQNEIIDLIKQKDVNNFNIYQYK